MFKILTKNVASDAEIAQGWPIGRSHRPNDRRVSLGRSRLILHWIDKIPKKNIFQSKLQKSHKKYPSFGWSRIFLVPIAVPDHRLARQIIAWRSWFRRDRHFSFCLCMKGDGALYLHYCRVLRGLKFCVRTRPAPTKFEPTPHPQEFEKFCPHPSRPADHPNPRPPLTFSVSNPHLSENY